MLALLRILCLFFVGAITAAAQTGPGGTWPGGVYTYASPTNGPPLTITALGTDFNQPAGGNSGYVLFSSWVGYNNGTTYYVCSWGGTMLVPFYNLTGTGATSGTPAYSADVNPAAKAMYNELLLFAALGKPITRVDFYLLDQSTISDGTPGSGTQASPYHRPCILKLVYASP